MSAFGSAVFLLILVCIVALPLILSVGLGERKGYGRYVGILLGLFLGWVGLIVVAILPDMSNRGASPEPDKADQLMKYKGLLDMGAITEEEYDKKKRELLEEPEQ